MARANKIRFYCMYFVRRAMESSLKRRTQMARFIVSVAITAIVFIAAQTYVYAETPNQNVHVRESSVRNIVQGNNQFTLNIYQQLTKSTSNGNVFFSPFSITVALAMTHLGAKGNTANEILQTLGLDKLPQKELHLSLKYLLGVMTSTDSSKYILKTANRLYVHDQLNILDTYSKDTMQFYAAEAKSVDFIKETEKARKDINSWTEEQTNNKITELIQPGVLSSNSRLVLVNAIYFKGDWTKQFDSKLTQQSEFYVSEKKTSTVDMMFQKSKCMYGVLEELDAQALALSYLGDELKMMILLPNDKQGLAKLEENLNIEFLSSINTHLRNTTIEVYLPKFRLTREFELAPNLAKMGMIDLFSPGKADLSGINGGRDLFVDHVIHKAFIEVNEEGSEAAGATAVGIQRTSMELLNKFKADHPFLFYIQETKTDLILFMGRVTEPDLFDSTRDEL